MLAAGTLTHVIGARFSLSDIVAAHEAVESRQVVGNVIVDVAI
jgi:NADPH2:quinone reductase